MDGHQADRIAAPLLFRAASVVAVQRTLGVEVGITDHLATALTGRAGTLDGEEALLRANLTGPLTKENMRLFEKSGEMVFWTDDTHWNPKGIAVAARVLCGVVPEMKCRAASVVW